VIGEDSKPTRGDLTMKLVHTMTFGIKILNIKNLDNLNNIKNSRSLKIQA